MHRVWVGPQRRVEGGLRACGLKAEIHRQEIEMSIGSDEQVVAASSEMRGEKYRDEVGLERSEGNDRPTRQAGGGHPINRAQLEERR